MRVRVPALVWIGAMLVATYGCSGKSASEPGAAEPTSGGEAPAGSAEGESAEAQSPWGATRAEQCRREAPPAMSSKAKKSFDNGVRAAAGNDTGTADARFQEALDKDQNAYPALYNLGVLADRSGNERDAMSYYQRALRVVPDYEPAVRGIATIQIRRDQVPGAVATVEPLANEYRANLEMQALYAEVLVEARRLDEAWMAGRKYLTMETQ